MYRGTSTGPSPHRHSRVGGNPVLLFAVILSAAKNLASPSLKPRSERWRACRILLTPGRSFSPSASYFLSTATRSNQETAPRCLRPAIARAIAGSPALLGRGGRFRQAIPGLSETASASLPRPRLRAADPPRPVRLGAARRGKRPKPHQKQSHNNIKSAGFAICNSPLPLREGARGRGAFDVAVLCC